MRNNGGNVKYVGKLTWSNLSPGLTATGMRTGMTFVARRLTVNPYFFSPNICLYIPENNNIFFSLYFSVLLQIFCFKIK